MPARQHPESSNDKCEPDICNKESCDPVRIFCPPRHSLHMSHRSKQCWAFNGHCVRPLIEGCWLRDGCTAIMAVGQPTTDICSFFSRAYILVNGEVVYFGDTGTQAMRLLASAGMPCPPLYSPVEQYIRLVDSTFEAMLLSRLSTCCLACVL